MKYQVEQAIEVLRNTPVVLRSMLAGLSEPWIHNSYGPDTFCPFDVVGHLIHGERSAAPEELVDAYPELTSDVTLRRPRLF